MKIEWAKMQWLLDENDVTAYKVAKDLGFSQSMFPRWKSGKCVPKYDKIEKISDYFGIDILYFYENVSTLRSEKEDFVNHEMQVAYNDAVENIKDKRIYDVAAGQGRINDEYENTSEYSTVRICGDSMYPSLHDGDLVRVHHVTDDIAPHDFAIVKINGDESTCKHIEITNDGIWLRAENNDVFEDTFYSVQEVLTVPVTIIGKAVAIVERKL